MDALLSCALHTLGLCLLVLLLNVDFLFYSLLLVPKRGWGG